MNLPDVPVDIIWAAACQAYSTNNGYVKPEDLTFSEDHEGKKANRDLIQFYAVNPDLISEQSIKDGEEVRNYLKGMIFKILAEDKTHDYIKKLINLASNDDLKITINNIAFLASAPQAVVREQIKDDRNRQLRECDGYVGIQGDSVQVNFKIINSYYSDKWERWYVTAITDDKKMITYSTKNKRIIDPGKVVTATAMVKQHFINDYTKHETTRLSNVKTGLE